jgi:hypothetical protein
LTGPSSSPTPSRRSAVARVDELLRERLFGRAPHIGLIRIGEDLIHYAVALVLLAVAAIVLYNTAYDLAMSKESFAVAATAAVNGVLFAIIVLEVMRTVVAHFERGGLQLQSFLIIGIISAPRRGLRSALTRRAPRGGCASCSIRCLQTVGGRGWGERDAGHGTAGSCWGWVSAASSSAAVASCTARPAA